MENWKDQYICLLDNYLKDENELSLYRVSLLGKEMIEDGISPEEVVEAHLGIFKKIIRDINFREWIPYFYKSFNLLIELMTVFGITYRENTQLQEELEKTLAIKVAYKRLKFYADEMEFVTARLASMNEELDRHVMELSSLQKISKAINSVLEFDQLLKSISYSLEELTEYENCSIILFGKDNTLEIKDITVKGNNPFSEQYKNLHIAVSENAIQKRDICIVTDLLNDERFDTNELKCRSLISIPMLVGKEIIGTITMDSNKPGNFTEDTSQLFSIVGSHAGIAIKNSITFEEIKKISRSDGLTGVYNHHYFYERLKTELDWARHYSLPLSLLMVDIDDFKQFNDNYGHTMGDQALKTVADILLRSTRHEDVVARYGGEEFAVILVSVDVNIAQKIADRIQRDIMENIIDSKDGINKSITVSIGCSNYPSHAQNVKLLVDCADNAMYMSKKAGKNCVTIFPIIPQ